MFYQIFAASSLRHMPRFRHGMMASVLLPLALLVCASSVAAQQSLERELSTPERVEIVIRNRHGRVTVLASEEHKKVSVRAETSGAGRLAESDVRTAVEGGRVEIDVGDGDGTRGGHRRDGGGSSSSGDVNTANAGGRSNAASGRERIDLTVRVPARSRVRVETEGGAVDVVGNVESAEVETNTGTIRADVPLDALKYNFQWTASRPRFYSEVELSKMKERRGGVYEIAGRFGDKKAKKEARIDLRLVTERGVVLFGVADASMVPTDLRERALTESARAIIRSGDSLLIDAIRKTAPRLVGDYAETLPARVKGPSLIARRSREGGVATAVEESVARVNASVTDRHGRAIGGLTEKDFALFENGQERPVQSVTPTSAPFNLVLLLDVSGSVEERLDFIRKAALAFLNTAGSQDRIAIISFRDDVQLISEFTNDRSLLAQRIKKIDAGGGTALYDSLAYTLAHTLRPLRGERAAVVILSDGDDNKSFIPFNTILEAVLESGALIYPLYIPSGLIPANGSASPVSVPAAAPTTTNTTALDPFRTRFLTVTSRADEEGRKLAALSGGVYYPITRLDQLQQAYDDVVTQLRTAYTITYASKALDARDARIRLRVAREDAAVRLSPAISVASAP